jgi:hypothetical protein
VVLSPAGEVAVERIELRKLADDASHQEFPAE